METQTANQPNVLEQFAILVRQHDLSYKYSDDHRAWSKGCDERAAIMALYDAQDAATQSLMVDVWNKVITLRCTPEFAHEYLWRHK